MIHKFRRRAINRRYRYGMDQDEFDYRMLEQSFSCPICKEQLHSGNAHVDHDHDTNDNRGLLCGECNSGIGKLKDKPNLIENANEYLKRFT